MKKNRLFATCLALLCLIGFSSCDNDVTGPLNVPTDMYFEADMNGKLLTLPVGKDGYESYALVSEINDATDCFEIQSMRISKDQNLLKSLEVAIIQRLENCSSDCSQSKEMFQKVTYTFGKLPAESNSSPVEGVVIRYTDVDGKVWSTDFGSANQTGSSFSLVNHIENKMDDKSEMLSSAEFSCKLYDTEGNEMILQNGKIVSRSVQCN